MKKSLLIVAAVLMMSSAAFAGGGFGFTFGPKVGYQTAKLSYQRDDIKAGFMNHFTIGLFGRVEIGGFYIQPEALWFKTSNAFDLNTTVDHNFNIENLEVPTGANLTFTMNSMNIQVPIMLGYKFNIINNLLAIRAQAGPTLNFVIPQQTLVSQGVGSSQAVVIDNQSLDTKKIAFGLQGGIGVDVLKRITLDINYNFGITKMFGAEIINNTSWGQYVDTNNISDEHTNMFMVTLGFKIL